MVKKVLLIWTVISLMSVGLSYAEPRGDVFSADPIERAFGAFYLGESNATAAVPQLIKLLKDNSQVRYFESPYFTSPRSGRDFSRTSPGNEAEKALVKMGTSAVMALIDALSNQNPDVRARAASALGAIRDNRAVEPLIGLLNDGNSNVRYLAAWALGKLKESHAVKPLIEALADEHWLVRDKATDALATIGGPAVKPLVEILTLKDPKWKGRLRVIRALGQIKDKRAVASLIEALRDEDKYVREEAIRSLREVTGVSFVRSIFLGGNPSKWQRWWEKNR